MFSSCPSLLRWANSCPSWCFPRGTNNCTRITIPVIPSRAGRGPSGSSTPSCALGPRSEALQNVRNDQQNLQQHQPSGKGCFVLNKVSLQPQRNGLVLRETVCTVFGVRKGFVDTLPFPGLRITRARGRRSSGGRELVCELTGSLPAQDDSVKEQALIRKNPVDTLLPSKIQSFSRLLPWGPHVSLILWSHCSAARWRLSATNDVTAPREVQRPKVDSGCLRRKKHFITEQSLILMLLWDFPVCCQMFLELVGVAFCGHTSHPSQRSIPKYFPAVLTSERAPQMQV